MLGVGDYGRCFSGADSRWARLDGADRMQLANVASLIDARKPRPILGVAFPLSGARQAYAHKSRFTPFCMLILAGTP